MITRNINDDNTLAYLLNKNKKETTFDPLSIYPVGSIYMSTVDVNPASFIGGTWERIRDRFLLAAGDNHSAGDTGGSESHTLTVDELPSHTHTIGAHSHGLNNHTHSLGEHVHGLNSHVHGMNNHTHGMNNHTHGLNSHTHGLNSHVHSLGDHVHGLGSHKHTISHTHTVYGIKKISTTLARAKLSLQQDGNVVIYANDNTALWNAGTANSKTRAFTTVEIGLDGDTSAASATNSGTATGNTGAASGDTGAASGSTAAATGSTAAATGNTAAATGNTAAATGNTAAASGDTGAASGNTASKAAYDSGATGSGSQINWLPPYLAVYMWKRTA